MLNNYSTHFMELAKKAARKSQDPKTQVGCVVVSAYNRILSISNNRIVVPVKHIKLSEKNLWFMHAEQLAIRKTFSNGMAGSPYALYMWSSRPLLPCSTCANHIYLSGIKYVYVNSFPPTEDSDKEYGFHITKQIFQEGGIKMQEFSGK